MNDAHVIAAHDRPAPDEDPAFSGVFPGFDGAGGECSCGQDHGEDGVPSLRPYRPVALDDAAELASTSALMREVLAFADWVGDGRPLTPSNLLKPKDAVVAALELGLLDEETLTERTLVSSEDLPELHELWTAAVRAGLLTIRGGKAYRGDARSVWESGTAQERLDSWAGALAGVLVSLGEQAQRGMVSFDLPMPEVLPITAQAFYTFGLIPVAAMLPGIMMMSELDPMDPASVETSAFLVPASVETAVRLWTRAGVLEPVDPQSPDLGSSSDLLGTLAEDLDSDLLVPMGSALRDNGFVRVTSLGEYGLMRLLRAHGFTVPMPGDLADAEPGELLDVLSGFPLTAALAEATAWLAARGGEALPHLRELGRMASTKYPIGPARRASFTRMLIAATESNPDQAVTLVEAFDDDPWLAASAAVTAARLKLRELTLAEELWLEVDELSQVLDDSPDLQAVDAEHAPLLDVLARPGAVEAIAEVHHVHAPAVFRLAAQVMDDKVLARQVRAAAAGGVVDLRGKKHGREQPHGRTRGRNRA